MYRAKTLPWFSYASDNFCLKKKVEVTFTEHRISKMTTTHELELFLSDKVFQTNYALGIETSNLGLNMGSRNLCKCNSDFTRVVVLVTFSFATFWFRVYLDNNQGESKQNDTVSNSVFLLVASARVKHTKRKIRPEFDTNSDWIKLNSRLIETQKASIRWHSTVPESHPRRSLPYQQRGMLSYLRSAECKHSFLRLAHDSPYLRRSSWVGVRSL